jgi:hypothetical protein
VFRGRRPLLAEPDGLDVAVAVEHGERVAVLQDSSTVVGEAGGREDVVAIVKADDVVHRDIPLSRRSARYTAS